MSRSVIDSCDSCVNTYMDIYFYSVNWFRCVFNNVLLARNQQHALFSLYIYIVACKRSNCMYNDYRGLLDAQCHVTVCICHSPSIRHVDFGVCR